MEINSLKIVGCSVLTFLFPTYSFLYVTLIFSCGLVVSPFSHDSLPDSHFLPYQLSLQCYFAQTTLLKYLIIVLPILEVIILITLRNNIYFLVSIYLFSAFLIAVTAIIRANSWKLSNPGPWLLSIGFPSLLQIMIYAKSPRQLLLQCKVYYLQDEPTSH